MSTVCYVQATNCSGIQAAAENDRFLTICYVLTTHATLP